jgi:hypothetical protein
VVRDRDGGDAPCVSDRECGAGCGDRQQVGSADRMAAGDDGEDVERSLHDDWMTRGRVGCVGFIQPVEEFSLVEQGGLAGVQVFRCIRVAGHVTSDEPGDAAFPVVHREDHPVAEGVDQSAAARAES